jgi:SnoaL-like domain
MEAKSKRDEIIELVNKLFIYTDNKDWDKLLAEVFTEKVMVDLSSTNGSETKEVMASEICKGWKEGLVDSDAIHHQAGNFLIKLKNDDVEAEVFCYAVATHVKKNAAQGLQSFTGSYDLHAVLTDQGWRLDSFRYTLKFSSANTELK